MLNSSKKAEFILSLRDVGRWLEYSLNASDPMDSLRTSYLKPSVEDWEFVNFDKYFLAELQDVRMKRKELLKVRNVPDCSRSKGRILCFYPELSLKDAVAGKVSLGYFDDSDCPPWDSWIHYDVEDLEQYHNVEYSCLLSLVPDSLVPIVDKAILEDTYDCLVWADKLEKELSIRT